VNEQLRGSRMSKDNTPKDQMGSILKEEAVASAADTPAVKIAGSVGRYSNSEYWQHKSETFKQQVSCWRASCAGRAHTLPAAQQRGAEHGAADAQGAHARLAQPHNLGVNMYHNLKVNINRRGTPDNLGVSRAGFSCSGDRRRWLLLTATLRTCQGSAPAPTGQSKARAAAGVRHVFVRIGTALLSCRREPRGICAHRQAVDEAGWQLRGDAAVELLPRRLQRLQRLIEAL
jgi:hypothetical protein